MERDTTRALVIARKIQAAEDTTSEEIDTLVQILTDIDARTTSRDPSKRAPKKKAAKKKAARR